MPTKHPILPDHRPLAIAHRGGNSLEAAWKAIELGIDMLETDVWPYLGRLEVRHVDELGPGCSDAQSRRSRPTASSCSTTGT